MSRPASTKAFEYKKLSGFSTWLKAPQPHPNPMPPPIPPIPNWAWAWLGTNAKHRSRPRPASRGHCPVLRAMSSPVPRLELMPWVRTVRGDGSFESPLRSSTSPCIFYIATAQETVPSRQKARARPGGSGNLRHKPPGRAMPESEVSPQARPISGPELGAPGRELRL